MSLKIETFPCLSDNYGFLLHDSESGATASIDAPDADAVRQALNRRNWILTDIFVTHHHWDHTEGIEPLKTSFDVAVTGPAAEADKIKGLTKTVKAGDPVKLGSATLDVMATPGHTLGHIVYFDAEGKNLFSGDALFSLGCGRMFEGTPGPMWAGLKSLSELPNETMVHCGHEYSAANAAFALSIDPDNEALNKLAADITELRAKGLPTVPFNLGEDKAANPFLRADNADLSAKMGLPESDPTTVFAAIRKAKDRF